MATFSGFSSVPLMILSKIMSYLDQVDLHSCCQVSHWWHQVALRPSTWRSLKYTCDNASMQLVKQLAPRLAPFIAYLTVDTSVPVFQLKTSLKHCQNLLSFTHTECRFSKHYTSRICGASNAEILAALAANCHKLQQLVLVQSSDITAKSFEAFAANCIRLRYLDTGKACLSAECCALLPRLLPSLAIFISGHPKLFTNSWQLDRIGLVHLTHCPLTSLMIAVRNIDLDLMCQAVTQCPRLERFACFSGGNDWSDISELARTLGSACLGLRTVSLPEAQLRCPGALESLVNGCPSVEAAKLRTGPQISHAAMQCIGQGWVRLRELSLTVDCAVPDSGQETSGCPFAGLTDDRCGHLQTLQIACSNGTISADSLASVLLASERLTDLKLVLTQSSGDALLQTIASGRPRGLSHLHLSPKSNTVSSGVLLHFLASVPDLTQVTLGRTDLNPREVAALLGSPCVRNFRLVSLCLTQCSHLTDACFGYLGSLPCLTELRLHNLKLITNGAAVELLSTDARHRLRHLALRNGHLDDNLTNAVFDQFGHFTGLRTLELCFWSSLTNDGVAKLGGTACAKSLRSLKITGSALVTEDAVALLLQHKQLSFQYIV